MQHRNSYIVAALLAAAVSLGGCRGDADAGPTTDQRVDAVEVRGEARNGATGAERLPEGDAGADLAGPEQSDRGADAVATSDGAADPAPRPAGGTPAAPAQAEPAASPSDPAARALARVEGRYGDARSMSADFVQRLDVPLLGDVQVSRGRLYQRQPNRFAMHFTDPEGDVVIADGRHLWMYYPSSDPRQVMRTGLQGGAELDLMREFLTDTSARFRAAHEGTETVSGRSTDRVRLVPRERAGYSSVVLWVDRENGTVHRIEISEANDTVRRLDLANVRLNPQIPDDRFRFEPPAGAQVFDQ
jgi:outer membrane lipoprotein carrier protein